MLAYRKSLRDWISWRARREAPTVTRTLCNSSRIWSAFDTSKRYQFASGWELDSDVVRLARNAPPGRRAALVYGYATDIFVDHFALASMEPARTSMPRGLISSAIAQAPRTPAARMSFRGELRPLQIRQIGR